MLFVRITANKSIYDCRLIKSRSWSRYQYCQFDLALNPGTIAFMKRSNVSRL